MYYSDPFDYDHFPDNDTEVWQDLIGDNDDDCDFDESDLISEYEYLD